MKRSLLLVLFVVLAIAVIGHDAMANPFLSGRPSEMGAAGTNLTATPFLQTIMEYQRQIHQSLTDHLNALKDGKSLAALWALLLLGFGYGVFHVLAPGHGKVIVGSYFLGHAARWRDGVWAGLIMAIGHTATAIGLVLVLYFVFSLSQFSVLDRARYVELVGYGMIGLIGLWLLYKAIRNAPDKHGCCGHNHSHQHNHKHNGESILHNREAISLFTVTSLVPCTGSMIILLFTLANGLLWAGVLTILAIALGMWATVTTIGTVAIVLRHAVIEDEKHPTPTRRHIIKAAGILAALIVIATGGLMFTGTLYGMMG